LLGDPVSHSLSPRIQNAAMASQGIDAVYGALRCSSDDCKRLLPGLARANGGGNVTVPHKAVAALVVEQPSDIVQRTGACNTFWLEHGKICGDNTDVVGLRRTLNEFVGQLKGARVALLGALRCKRSPTALPLPSLLPGCHSLRRTISSSMPHH
jgi:shikimate dehydrogenase